MKSLHRSILFIPLLLASATVSQGAVNPAGPVSDKLEITKRTYDSVSIPEDVLQVLKSPKDSDSFDIRRNCAAGLNYSLLIAGAPNMDSFAGDFGQETESGKSYIVTVKGDQGLMDIGAASVPGNLDALLAVAPELRGACPSALPARKTIVDFLKTHDMSLPETFLNTAGKANRIRPDANGTTYFFYAADAGDNFERLLRAYFSKEFGPPIVVNKQFDERVLQLFSYWITEERDMIRVKSWRMKRGSLSAVSVQFELGALDDTAETAPKTQSPNKEQPAGE